MKISTQIVIAIIGLILVCSAGTGLIVRNIDNNMHVHRCYTPCVVVLPANTQEDEFDFNYTWPNDHTSVVEVWRAHNFAKGR